MVSSTVVFATLFFSRQAGASPAGVFANMASCKCLTAHLPFQPGNQLQTADCTMDLQNLITPDGSQSFYTDDQGALHYPASLSPATTVCVGAADPNESLVGQRAEIRDCDSETLQIYAKNSKLVTSGDSSYDLKMAEDDTLVFAEPDDTDDRLFEFHCGMCFGDESWTCGGMPAPAPSPDPSPTPAPPAPSPGLQIQWSREVNLCMDLPGGDTSNGALLWMWDCYGGDSQQWFFQDGQLVYSPDPSKCVDLLGGDTTNGNRLGIWDCYQGDSQLWGFDSDWGTIYLASSTASDATKCASVGGEHRGDPIDIWDCSEHDGGQQQLYQTWKVGSPEPSLVV